MNYTNKGKTVILSLFISMLIPLLGYTQSTDWVNVKIDSVATIEFPDLPIFQSVIGVNTYFFKSEDATFLIATLENKTDAATDSYTADYYLGFMDEIIKGSNAELKDTMSFCIGKFKGVQFTFINPQKVKQECRVILINGRAFFWSVTFVKSSRAMARNAKRFFNSFSYIKK